MSFVIKKIGRAFKSKNKDDKNSSDSKESDELQVDAIPTVIPREIELNDDLEEINSESQSSHSTGPINQANQFNSPSQTVYQFNGSSGIHIGNNFTINQDIVQHAPEKDDNEDVDEKIDKEVSSSSSNKPAVNNKLLRKRFPKTRTIELLLKSDKDIEHSEMDVIATHLGEDWRSVARDLGFSNGEIDHFYEDNFAYGVKEVIYKILTEWKQREEEPQLGIVCKILWSRDIHREVVHKLKLDFKQRQ